MTQIPDAAGKLDTMEPSELEDVIASDLSAKLGIPVYRGAPNMLAEAWDAAVAEGENGGWLHNYAAEELRRRNPYR